MIDKLHYISQADNAGDHLPAIEKALRAGCKWIQLRVKDQPSAAILKQAVSAKALCDAFDAKLIINDHAEVAAEVAAYGLHLGLTDMPIPEARSLAGPKLIIGGTANTIEHILQRIDEGADYVGLGPFRFTTTKKNLSPILGIEGFQKIVEQLRRRQIDIPVIAIGGLTIDDVPLLMKAGLYGIAVSGAITNAADPLHTVTTINKELYDIVN